MNISDNGNRNLAVCQTQSRYQTGPFYNTGNHTDDGYNKEEKTGLTDDRLFIHNPDSACFYTVFLTTLIHDDVDIRGSRI